MGGWLGVSGRYGLVAGGTRDVWVGGWGYQGGMGGWLGVSGRYGWVHFLKKKHSYIIAEMNGEKYEEFKSNIFFFWGGPPNTKIINFKNRE
jgi:hypothetical protein